jgi:signal transduction histidine kinase
MPGCPAQWLLLTFRDATCKQELERATLASVRSDAARAHTEAQLARVAAQQAGIPRELTVPMTRVRRAARWLARAASNPDGQDPRRMALLARILEARTDDLERQLVCMTDAAALEAGTLHLDHERVNLVPLVNRVVARARARWTAHRLKVSAPQGLTAMCDPRRVEAMLDELIRRAVRRNPRGCWIDVDLKRPLAGMARIEVRDYGRRPSTPERENLLHRSMTDRGWFVVKRVAQQHRGTLSVEFPGEGGVRVALTLPTHRGRTPHHDL